MLYQVKLGLVKLRWVKFGYVRKASLDVIKRAGKRSKS